MALDLKRTDGGNGHRRRQLATRVKAEETHCALCGTIVNKDLKHQLGQHNKTCSRPQCTGCKPHPMRAEVDEDLPRSRGGSPLDRDNVSLMHRHCNNLKSNLTIEEAKAKHANKLNKAETYASPGW